MRIGGRCDMFDFYKSKKRSRRKAYKINTRALKAKNYIKFGYQYPDEEIDQIVSDYAKVCLDTQLCIAGILNLEHIARYVIDRKLKGAFVECGTWRGGALAYWARSFLRNGRDDSLCKIYGFDSFEGMPRITSDDGDSTSRWLYGRGVDDVDEEMLDGQLQPTGMNVADYDECRRIVGETGYKKESTIIKKGWFQDTIPETIDEIGPASVLRLDGDFYESTKFCFEQLYDKVLPGGAVIIDDYGLMPGCKKATDEFLRERNINAHLHYVDVNVRYFVKPSVS